MLFAQITFWGAVTLYAIIGAIVALDNFAQNLSEPPWYPKPSPVRIGLLWAPYAVLEVLGRKRRPHA